jgi:hypothetical protein
MVLTKEDSIGYKSENEMPYKEEMDSNKDVHNFKMHYCN